MPDALLPVMASIYPKRPRLLFLLRRRADVDREAFVQALRDWRAQQPADVEPGSLVARAGAGIVDAQARLRAWLRSDDVEVIDGYVSLDVEHYEPAVPDFEVLTGAAVRGLEQLRAVIDSAETIAFGGIAHLVIPGVAPQSLILLLDRAPGLSLAAYNEWWVHHGDDHRRMHPAQVGYHQLHVAPELNAMTARATSVSTTDQCVVDLMYLARLEDAFTAERAISREESRALSADIAAHVSMTAVSGSFMQEL